MEPLLHSTDDGPLKKLKLVDYIKRVDVVDNNGFISSHYRHRHYWQHPIVILGFICLAACIFIISFSVHLLRYRHCLQCRKQRECTNNCSIKSTKSATNPNNHYHNDLTQGPKLQLLMSTTKRPMISNKFNTNIEVKQPNILKVCLLNVICTVLTTLVSCFNL